jgi:hypothetical protein
LRGPLGKVAVWGVALSGDAAGCLARVEGVGELLPATVTGAGGLWKIFAWVRGECAGGGGCGGSLFKAKKR